MSRPGAAETSTGTRPAGSGPQRHSVLADEAMVASAHADASRVGAGVLSTGGNAVDAALAMAAMTAVLLPAQCGVGGDAFAVVFDAATSTCTAVQGSGFGPDGADFDFFASRGETAVPLFGPCSVAVPGWVSAVEAIHKRWASRALPELFAPAIAAARSGSILSAKNAADLAEHEAALRADAATADVLLPGGRLPRVGERLVQSDLAATLERVAGDPRGFYTGALGERLVAALRDAGAPFSGDEWAAQEALVAPALEGPYAGHRVFTTALPSPGYMLLQQAGALDGVLGELELLGPGAIDLMARAAALCFADRFELVGSDSLDWAGLLAPEAIRAARLRLGEQRPLGAARVTGHGDTTSFVAVDRDANAVSFIHSTGFTWGARVTVAGTGVLMNDRLGRGAYLFEGHPNALKPRRRPMHTLHAWIVADTAGKLRAAGNTPGGDGQVQWNMQLLSHLLDHGLEAQEVVDAPRFSITPGSDANAIGDELVLSCESRVGSRVLEALSGSSIPVVGVGPFAGGGGAQLIEVSPTRGCLVGGSDSRQDGCARGA